MKKVMLYPVHQKNFTFYAMVADPRNVAAVMKRAKAAESQENQRPWSLSKVKEIARFVMGWMRVGATNHRVLGLLPNAPIISFAEKLEVQHDTNTDTYYVMFPETEKEFSQYANSVEVIDGQHRVLAFAEDLRDPEFSNGTRYEMIFSVFPPLGIEEKKELFMVTNEKQTKVESNLLRLFKKQLHLLDDDEKLFDLVSRLNTEDYSPLKGRVIIGSDAIPKGYTVIGDVPYYYEVEFVNPETGESMIGYIYKGNLAAEESEDVEIQEEEASKATEIPETIPDTTEGQVASTE